MYVIVLWFTMVRVTRVYTDRTDGQFCVTVSVGLALFCSSIVYRRNQMRVKLFGEKLINNRSNGWKSLPGTEHARA